MGCQFGSNGNQPDGIFGVANQAGTSSVMRSMESSQYYPENNVEIARRWVSTIMKLLLIILNHFLHMII